LTFDQNPHIIRPGDNLVLAISGTITHTDPMQELERFFDAGGLMSYGATQSEIYGIAAEQVAKILDGARPDDSAFAAAAGGPDDRVTARPKG
jgi:hypothetical protein